MKTNRPAGLLFITAFSLLHLVFANCAGATLVNLARLGTATQSTTSGPAQRAIDGGLGTAYAYDATTTHTTDAPNSWWQVDLGDTYDLTTIELYNRGDCCPERLGNFRVSVLDAIGTEVWGNDYFPTGDPAPNYVSPINPLIVTLPAGTQGQTVKVQLNGYNNSAGTNGILSLREVRIPGEAVVPNGVNLASMYGTATQSSTLPNNKGPGAQKAIDGNTNRNFNAGSVSHTQDVANSFWEVDLESEFYLERVRLHNRDGSYSRLSNFRLSVLDADGNETYGQDVAGPVGAIGEFPLPLGTQGRKVRVQLNGFNGDGDGNLALAEAQVFGGTLPNVANADQNPNAVAWQTTTSSGGVAARAIDGNTDGNWGAGSITHTDPAATNSYWQVDLGGRFDLDEIVLYNRTDCCPNRLSNFNVMVIDPATGNTYSQYFEGPVGANQAFPLPENTRGQIVRVQLVGKNLENTGILSLAEVQAYGLEMPNAARNPNAVATQSSNNGAGVAPRAIDGNTNGLWAAGSVTHTAGGDASPWWQVDMGGLYSLDTIAVYNRTDSCCSGRLRDITVEILGLDGSTPVFTSQLLNPDNVLGGGGSDYAGGPATLTLDLVALTGGKVNGRVVRVSRTESTFTSGNPDDMRILSMAEVEAYGTEVENVALNPDAVATQSSEASGGAPGRAIDGNTDGVFGNGSITHTAGTADPNPWWQVDLGGLHAIDAIEIYNRTGCCSGRLRDITVEILGPNGTTVVFLSDLLNPDNVLGGGGLDYANGPATLILDLVALTGEAVIGQVVRVSRTSADGLTFPSGNEDDYHVLALAEVEIFGTATMVPEPSAIVLLILGGLAIIPIVRRRR